MKPIEEIEEVVVVGGGPVGNLSAVLAGFMGAKTTVYEKRETYTREINLKIQIDLFKDISRIFQHVSRKKDDFFEKMHVMLAEKDGKILLNTLEKTLKAKAEQLGVKYIIGKEIKSFKEVQSIHQKSNPIILDCTGRNSFLRVNQFGTDEENMKIYDLHHALHINFDTVIPRDFDYRLIYSIITNTDDLKLGDIVVGKSKNENSKLAHVTIPLFISQKLSKIFDEHFPTINRMPLKPFSYKKEGFIVQEDVESLLYSIFCPFVMEDWEIDWGSVLVKKINITCGYAVKRSRDRIVCLGDSAAHFAYFKSLNFGLKHAFQLMKTLSSYHGFKCRLGQFNEKQSIDLCKSFYPPLMIKEAKPGPAPSEYFIKTEAIIYSAMVFNVATQSIKKLDILPVFCVQKIPRLFNEYTEDSRQEPWQKSLDKFQKLRDSDIDSMILSNRSKRNGTEVISYLIWLDGLNPMKLADFINVATKGYALDKKDFDFFSKTFKVLKRNIEEKQKFKSDLNKCTKQVQGMVSSSIPKQFHTYCDGLMKLSEDEKFSMEEFSKFVDGIKWDRSSYDYKRGTLYIKILDLITKIYRSSQTKQK